MAFLIRFATALALLAATYNPTPWNYVRWALDAPGQLPLKVLAGLILLAVYIVFLTAVLRGIGALGVALVLAVAAAAVWVLYDFGLLSLDNPGLNTWIALVALALVLAVGMYWGILWRRVSGQVETEDEPG